MENEEKDVDLNNEEVEETADESIDESVEEIAEESTTEEETKVEKPKESLEDRRARLKRQLEQTEKKLGLSEKKPVEKTTSKESSYKLSDKDLIAIMSNKVHEDDIDEVIEISKLRKISVSEALKLNLTKTILANNAELRKSAQITNTGSARQATKKVSGDTLISNLSKGLVPEKGSSDAEELFWARRGGRR